MAPKTPTLSTPDATPPPAPDAAASAPPPPDPPPTTPAPAASTKAALYAFPVPDQFNGQPGADLLMEACSLYNINPDPTLVPGNVHAPRQLLEWKYYATNGERFDLPAQRVVLVTAGGLKLSYPADAETVERLQRIFRLIRKRKGPNNEEVVDTLPMPEDLTLPSTAVTGLVEAADHRYERGYLREGGKGEGSRRQQLRAKAGLA